MSMKAICMKCEAPTEHVSGVCQACRRCHECGTRLKLYKKGLCVNCERVNRERSALGDFELHLPFGVANELEAAL